MFAALTRVDTSSGGTLFFRGNQLVYEELRKLAAHKMANEALGQTLQATALVHEAWLRLAGADPRL